jgi:hypothetical protein
MMKPNPTSTPKVQWNVLGLSPEDARVLWRWEVPDPDKGYDGFSVGIHRVGSGVLVRAEWVRWD